MITGETESVCAAVETLDEVTVAVGTTMDLEEFEESVGTAAGTDTGTGETTDVARTDAGAGANCCTCGI
jgi:hypothetical protein